MRASPAGLFLILNLALSLTSGPAWGQQQVKVLTADLKPDERSTFYHLAEGSEIYPLDWLRALEIDVVGDDGETTARPFLENMERFGFLADPDSREGLPIGLTAEPVVGFEFLGKQVGLNCAACHVGAMTFQGTEFRIDGAPNLLDTRAFFAQLAEASEATLKHPAKALKFVRKLHAMRRIDDPPRLFPNLLALPDALEAALKAKAVLALRFLGEDDSLPLPPDDLWVKAKEGPKAMREALLTDMPEGLSIIIRGSPALEELVVKARIMKSRIAFLKRLKGVGDLEGTKWGPGRVDAFGSARRFLFDAKYAPIHGVSYPPLWDLYRTKSFHYDSNTNTFFERNIGQALGVGAVYSKADFSSTIRLANLRTLDELAMKLRAPKWPKELGELNANKVERGKVVFAQNCQRCHSTDKVWQEDLEAEIDTDPRRALQFALNVPAGPAFPDAIKSELAQIKLAAIERLPPAEQKLVRAADTAVGQTIWRATKKYSGRPLTAVWAAAPYLHNGSVPTLEDLLSKTASRPRHFFVGNREFDPIKVGYVSKAPAGRADNFDVSQQGNGNYGHEWGWDLSRADKDAVIEYLKAN